MKTNPLMSMFIGMVVGLLCVAPGITLAKNNNPGKLQPAVIDNFDSYSNGSVTSQGGWFDRANGAPWVVQGSVVEQGKKALYNNNVGQDSVITKTGPKMLSDGSQSFWVRTQNRSNWGDYDVGENITVGMYQGSWDGPSRIVVAFMKDGSVAYNSNITPWVTFDHYTDNTWTLITIEWRASDQTARYRVNNGTWTAWVPFHGGSSFIGFDTVGLFTKLLGSGGVYIDNLK